MSQYPTHESNLNLRQIELLRKLHPSLKIGFSTHEPPSTTASIGLALALGASVIEKHVGIENLNKYSASPTQTLNWLNAGAGAISMIGSVDRISSKAEQDSISALKRGVYASKEIEAGKNLAATDVAFAFPASPGQLTANEWSKYTMYEAKVRLVSGSAVMRSDIEIVDMRDTLHKIAYAVHEMVNKSGVVVPQHAALEVSHHYGLSEFDRTGISMFTLVNREYCKKMLLMLPGQTHPEQYHEKKEETFVVLHGEMELSLDGRPQIVKRGDVVTIPPGVRHAFGTANGVVFEEISTTHNASDSFYTDPKINGNAHRKTFINHWTNV